jgi:hypothetical protein
MFQGAIGQPLPQAIEIMVIRGNDNPLSIKTIIGQTARQKHREKSSKALKVF